MIIKADFEVLEDFSITKRIMKNINQLTLESDAAIINKSVRMYYEKLMEAGK